jgi:hypothetical protein
LVIDDVNDASAAFFRKKRESLRGLDFTALMATKASDNMASIDTLIARIEDGLRGRGLTVFEHRISM